jgi:hypothetical protein
MFYLAGACPRHIGDKQHFAQAKVQKTRDFGQKDGATGARLHHF